MFKTMGLPVLLLALAATHLAIAQSAPDPAAWPARDSHQGMLISADPYSDATRAKARFGKKHPQAHGVLAVDVYLRNDTDKPLRVTLDRILLLIEPPEGRRQRLSPLTVAEVLDRMLTKDRPGPDGPRPRLPIPRKDSRKEWRKLEELFSPLALTLGLVPPHSMARGFLFFDLDGRWELLAHAQLYIPELRPLGGEPLLFFELELSPRAPR